MNAPRTSLVLALGLFMGVGGCSPAGLAFPSPSAVDEPAATATAPASATAPETGSVVIVGRIVTMDEPPVAEALFIEDGTVTAVGARDEVLALAGDQVPVLDIGEDVAYPGSSTLTPTGSGTATTTHIETPAAAMDAAISRGWTSISEQWVNQERLDELTALAAAGELPLRVDAYLALNFGD